MCKCVCQLITKLAIHCCQNIIYTLILGEVLAYVEGRVGAGGVAGGELDAGGEVAVPVRMLRLETTP